MMTSLSLLSAEVVMLEHYFVKHQTVDRVRGCWLGDAIERYVAWLDSEGYAKRNVYRRVPLLCRFATFVEAEGTPSLERAAALVEDFAEHWVRDHAREDMDAAAKNKLAEEARNPINQLLRLELPGYVGGGRHARADPFRDEATGFFTYLREERGLKPASIAHYRIDLNRFARFLARQGIGSLREVSVATLAAFVVDSAPALARNTRRSLCASLQVFLRYCYREHILAADLSAAVEMPQTYRLAELPRSISWDDVRRMLAAVDRRSARGIRDYAILLLLVTYGLRAHEVAELTLDDIDWARERLCVPERKAGHSSVYPLAAVVGEAIVAYLQEVRPKTSDRHVFFRVLAPVHPLRASAISQSVGHYLRLAGIEVRRAGSHTLRHTCVQHLVDADVSIKVIGDYVGHRSASATGVYTKIATEALREVAMGDGEAL